VLALVYLHAQSKPDAVGDVQPVERLTAKLGQTPVVAYFRLSVCQWRAFGWRPVCLTVSQLVKSVHCCARRHIVL